ncbi:LysM peptidoglycan-binding domain-containing protein [Sinomicrobium soli]|uniref:LysM peptidoglycan-binding domain-containing protein n=1 Tax=Sinomicrobium sp. N-1-3-6 TaxID=2219864 RepID=UPI000DCC63AA|nr:LysM peptidoglycan-binding domain-containing protein [Sinomicrobium sp. N-1-3-6]RAV28229.1 peptidoglycan-binding protein [Sinomicrobium sp. N-1-3-6]
MSLKAKYQAVIDLGNELKIKEGSISEHEDHLQLKGTAGTQYEKNLIWDKIKEIGGNQPADIKADIKVAEPDASVYHRHTVQTGESLSKIARKYYGDANKYNTIFQANTDQLKNPDLIQPGQELVIPKL